MQITRKRLKQIDRLSALPDGVVCHILSFLPTKLSAATSILAKRWRFMWAHVSNLDFAVEYFKPAVSHRDAQPSDIIHRVMCLHRAANLNTFSLSYIPCSGFQLETWITIAFCRNLRNLNLDLDPGFSFQYDYMLPPSLFTCQTLVNLKLVRARLNPSIVGSVSMPSLRKLHLMMVSCEVDEDLPHLVSGCPVLEEFIIGFFNIKNRNLGCLNISSPTIKRLGIVTMFKDLIVGNPDYRLEINAPALRYFELKDFSNDLSLSSFKHLSISPMTSLNEANIHLHTCLREKDDSTRSAVKFFKCLSNVKCLKLSGPYPGKFLDVTVAGSIPRFDNLTKLEVKFDGDWSFITKLLEIADNLEVLIVGIDGIYWSRPKQVPECILSSIRTIKFYQNVCTENGFNMVRYFLRHAQVLERMEIFSKHDEDDFKGKFDALQKISLFERGSKACQLAFC